MHHTKADVERLYIPRNKGRRGMIQLELSYKHQLLVNTNTLQQQQIRCNNYFLHKIKQKSHCIRKQSYNSNKN